MAQPLRAGDEVAFRYVDRRRGIVKRVHKDTGHVTVRLKNSGVVVTYHMTSWERV